MQSLEPDLITGLYISSDALLEFIIIHMNSDIHYIAWYSYRANQAPLVTYSLSDKKISAIPS